ncbi:hypothetical protein PMV51_13295 [Enterococcus avium]|uniref:hypothetical protein n=1 Tax=Enterococcus avium TaxID=33945 RepID=UPI00232B03FB|nr:hypothetical protein [Enterococcus avium]MDB1750207.1 hypothetical protein [Enterococcus avium]MDB1754299.1 hypothetical protein [Enterococcus avium]MDB1761389.1 hypothetical protein [Enterococcus avium]
MNAQGKIFSVQVPRTELNAAKKQVQIISLQQDGSTSHLRFIGNPNAAIMSHPLVIEERPTLEDAYLYLLSMKGGD